MTPQAKNACTRTSCKGWSMDFPWSLREEYGSPVTLTSAQWSWFLTSGSQNVERIRTSVVWSHKAASRKPEENSFMCTWVSLQLLCWAYQQVWHKASHKLDRKGHSPWNYGNSDAGTRRDKCPSPGLEGAICKKKLYLGYSFWHVTFQTNFSHTKNFSRSTFKKLF